MLLLFRGDTWRALRKMMSPTFTSGRLKSMMTPIENLADSTLEFIAQKAKGNPEIDLKPMMQYFSIDVICKVAFGLDTKCRTEEDPDMHKLFTSIMEDFKFDTYPKATIWAILSHFPELLSKLGFWPASMLKMRTMTKDIMTEREQKNIKIGDFVDRLMEYKKLQSHQSPMK